MNKLKTGAYVALLGAAILTLSSMFDRAPEARRAVRSADTLSSHVPAAASAANTCFKDGDFVSLLGTIVNDQVSLLDGSVKQVRLMITRSPLWICARDRSQGVQAIQAFKVNQVQIVGETANTLPIGDSVHLKGTLSTHHVDPAYAVPTALELATEHSAGTTASEP